MSDYSNLPSKKHSLVMFGLKAKRITMAILIVCLICGLSACGSKTSEKTDKQISNDIQQQDEYFNTYGLEIDSFSVSKRQTNVDEKNDFVWCEITASNDTFSYLAEYELTYVLYNDGWLLEEYVQNSSTVTPISPPTQTQDEAMALVLTNWDQQDKSNISESHLALKSSLQKESDLAYAYYFRMAWKNRQGLPGIPVDYAVYYWFDLASGWNTEVTTNVNVRWG